MPADARQRSRADKDRAKAEKVGRAVLESFREDVARMHLGIGPEERFDTFLGSISRLFAGRKARTSLDLDQFYFTCQTLGLPMDGLPEAFAILDVEGKNDVPIVSFVKAMLEPPAALTNGSPVKRSNHVKYNVVDDPRNGRSGGYPTQSPSATKGTDETNFMGSRGITRERRTENGGKNPNDMTVASPSRGLNSSVHVHNQQRGSDQVNMSEMVIDSFRQSLVRRGGSSAVNSLGRILRVKDQDGNRKLNLAELKAGLQEFGVAMDDQCMRLVVTAMDKRGNGSTTYEDFIAALRGPISSGRRRLIDDAFNKADKKNRDQLKMEDIQSAFSAKYHPDVAAGRLSEDQALGNWLAQFDSMAADRGTVSREDFSAYYKNVSATIPDENSFESMIRGLWKRR